MRRAEAGERRRLPTRSGYFTWQDRVAWALLALGLVLLQVPRSPLFAATVPLQTVFLAPLRIAGSLRREFAARRDENERLAELAARLAVENARLQTALRLAGSGTAEVVGARSPGEHRLVQAPVIARDIGTMQRYLVVSRGRRDGVGPGAPAVSPQGLVGVVVEAGPNQALVQTVLDFESRVAARAGSSRGAEAGQSAFGVARADRSGRMRLDFVEREADIRPGDSVITSGLGGVFPRGLFVGLVTVSENRPAELFRHVELEPAAPIRGLELVFIYRLSNIGPARLPGEEPQRPGEESALGRREQAGAGDDPWLDNLQPREVGIPGED